MAPCGNGCFWHVASVHGEAAQGPESENTADLSLCERRLAVGEKKGRQISSDRIEPFALHNG